VIHQFHAEIPDQSYRMLICLQGVDFDKQTDPQQNEKFTIDCCLRPLSDSVNCPCPKRPSQSHINNFKAIL